MKRARSDDADITPVKRRSVIDCMQCFDRRAAVDCVSLDSNLNSYAKLQLLQVLQLFFESVRPHLFSLPNELLLKIISHLDCITLVVARRVCKTFYRLCRHQAIHTNSAMIVPVSWLVRHYPNSKTFNIALIRQPMISPRFFESLASSVATSICLYMENFCRKNISINLRDCIFSNVDRLEIRGDFQDCPCYLLRGDHKYLHQHFPKLKCLLLWHIPVASHVPRCKLLTFVKRNIYKIEDLQLGKAANLSCSDSYSELIQRVFLDNIYGMQAAQLHRLRLYFCHYDNIFYLLLLAAIPREMPRLRWLEIGIGWNQLFLLSTTEEEHMVQTPIFKRLLKIEHRLYMLITHISTESTDALLSQLQQKPELLWKTLQALPNSFCNLWKPVFHLSYLSTFSYYDCLLPAFRKRGIACSHFENGGAA